MPQMAVRPGVTIRRAGAHDAEAIATVVRAAYGHMPADTVPSDMPLYHAEFHADALSQPAKRGALLVSAGRVLGVACWRMLPQCAHLDELFVHADHQGHGYGNSLLRHHQHEAQDEARDLRLLTLYCPRSSHHAERFYRHHGYVLYEPGDEGRHPDLYLWIDACRHVGEAWPPRSDLYLFYKLVKG